MKRRHKRIAFILAGLQVWVAAVRSSAFQNISCSSFLRLRWRRRKRLSGGRSELADWFKRARCSERVTA